MFLFLNDPVFVFIFGGSLFFIGFMLIVGE